MKNRTGLITALLTMLTSGVVAAQTPAPLLYHSLDEDANGWVGSGTNARVTVTRQSSFNGQGSLKFEYDVKAGQFCALVLSAPDAKLEKAKTFRFWVNADYVTTLAMILQEKDGGRYVVPFAVSKNKWQKVEIASTDFILMEGKDNPPDADGKLDLDQVGNIAITDIGQFFAMSGNPEMDKMLQPNIGAHMFLMDDFTVTQETLPGAYTTSAGEVRIDTFARPQLSWVTIGGMSLSRLEPDSRGARGMQVDYSQAAGRIVGLMRFMPKGKLQGASRLHLTVASSHSTMLLVQFEESGGGKFNTTIDIPEGGASKTVTLEMENFNPSDDSAVKDRKVKPELVTGFVILDATGMLGMTTGQENTLRITGLRAAAK